MKYIWYLSIFISFYSYAQKNDLIEQYHDFAFGRMRPTTRVFLTDFPDDPKTKIVKRYLDQLSFSAFLYKYIKKLPESKGIPQEVKIAYQRTPVSNFVYHFIKTGEFSRECDQLYDPSFNPQQAWKDWLTEIEEAMNKQLEDQFS